MSITKYGTAERDVAKTAEGRTDAVKAAEALRNRERHIDTERIEKPKKAKEKADGVS